MENKTFYNEVLIEHNQHPIHKEKLPDANLVLEGVNPSCGDDIILQLKVENDVIVDGAFEGSGCAISQASADIMLDMIIGQGKEEALHLAKLFLKMIQGKTTADEMDELEEAGVQILTCGTCLNYYGLTEKLKVGGVTNMYVIAQTMAEADLVVRP